MSCPYEYVAVGCGYIETPESRSTISQIRTLIEKSYISDTTLCRSACYQIFDLVERLLRDPHPTASNLMYAFLRENLYPLTFA